MPVDQQPSHDASGGQAIAAERPRAGVGWAVWLRRRWLAWLCKAAALAAIVWLLMSAVAGARGAALVAAASPYVALSTAIATRAVWLATVLAGLPLAAIALVRPRWFCRRLCPTGLLCDAAGGLNPLWRKPGVHWPAFGRWLALATFAAAVGGFALFTWLDPLAMLVGTVNAARARPLQWAAVAAAGPLLGVLLLSVLLPGVWCAKLCPLGGTQDLLRDVGRIAIRQRRPSGTSNAAKQPDGNAPATNDSPATSARLGFGRRAVLAGGAGAACAMLAQRTRASAGPLRPPGAADGARFSALCIRCGNCVSVCPSRILAPDLAPAQWTRVLAPVVRFADGYCLEDCCRCADACPSGAIAPFTVAEKAVAAIGIAKVDLDVCLLADDHECGICRNQCPFEAITIGYSAEEDACMVRVDANRCPGCGACEVACPTAPVRAIVVVARDEAKSTLPK